MELWRFVVVVVLILTKHPVCLLATLRFQPHHPETNVREKGMNIHNDFDSVQTGQLGPLILVLRDNIRFTPEERVNVLDRPLKIQSVSSHL